MDNIYNNYLEEKNKYITLKNSLINSLVNDKNETNKMDGGARSRSTYMHNGLLYKVWETNDHYSFTFREVPLREIDESKFTTDLRKPDKNKIIYIDDPLIFDFFTKKYAKYDTWNLIISWNKVSKDYGGFYLNRNNKKLFEERYGKARKGDYRMNSWWIAEYDKMPHNVMIFD
jgi:hypothetical protein